MYCFIIIGAPGMGKSPFIKDYINGINCFVFDCQNEWGLDTKYPGQVPVNLSNDITAPRCRFTSYNPKEFIRIAGFKRNTAVVFEDATMFFEGRTVPEMRELLARRRFTKNNYLLVFHSIASVPPRMMQFADYVVLFKTNDELSEVERKYRKLADAFLTLQKLEAGTHKIIKTI